MHEQNQDSGFQELIEKVEMFSLDDREILLDILQKRISEQRRSHLAKDIAEIREDYRAGRINFGIVDDF